MKLRKVVFNFLNLLNVREKLMFWISNNEESVLLGFKYGNYLYDIGWINSIITGNVVDGSNNPLPWVTYPYIQFITKRLRNNMTIFEFGSGNSTLFYANKVATVDSVDHDKFWYDKIKNSMPSNVNLYFCEPAVEVDYSNYPAKINKQFDILVVDGIDRVNCCINNIHALSPSGVIILDDSERIEYELAINYLVEKGFKKIDFWGIAPNIDYLKSTTIFYRNINCLGI